MCEFIVKGQFVLVEHSSYRSRGCFLREKPKSHQRLKEVELTGHGTRRIEELSPIDVGSELLATALRCHILSNMVLFGNQCWDGLITFITYPNYIS